MKIVISNTLRISSIPSSLYQVLIETFTFANPKWIENVKMNRWNRGTPKFLRFYRKTKGDGLTVPRGYLRQFILLCRKENVDYSIDDKRNKIEPVDFVFKGQLKPFQQTAVQTMLSKDFGTLSAPTGSGKTVMALYMIAQRRQPALIVVHTKELAFQWVNRIGTFLGISDADVGMIGAGKKSMGEKITVALVQTLYKYVDEVVPDIGYLIVDECHRAPSRTFTEAVSEFNSRYMMGLSATPWRRDGLSKLIFWHLGDVHHDIEKKHLIESGDVLRAEVITRHTDFKPYHDPVNEYSKMLAELTANDDRNRLIASDVALEAKKNAGVCLVLSDRKKHCETLHTLLRFKYNIRSELLTGDLKGSERKEVIERLNMGDVKVIVATGQLIGEGFDNSMLTTLFITTPVRFSGRVLQYLGRVLRPSPGKKVARIYDYIDIHVEPLAASARARQKVYDS